MALYTDSMKTVVVASALGCLTAVVACASPEPARPAASTPTLETRLMVKLVRPSDDGAAIARAAAQSAGVPVRYVASSSAQWHVIVLRCDDAARCESGVERLRRDVATFEAVQQDDRMRPMAR